MNPYNEEQEVSVEVLGPGLEIAASPGGCCATKKAITISQAMVGRR